MKNRKDFLKTCRNIASSVTKYNSLTGTGKYDDRCDVSVSLSKELVRVRKWINLVLNEIHDNNENLLQRKQLEEMHK